MPTLLSAYPGVLVWVQFICPLVVEGFLFGFYTGCFVLYLYLHAMKTLKDSDAKRNILIYPLCMVYGLSALHFILDMKDIPDNFGIVRQTLRQICLENNIYFATSSFYHFLSQSILIYRCWIVWGRKTSVTIIPLLLAFAAFGITLSQLADGTCYSNIPDLFNVYQVLYLVIDGLVMGLIVLKIVMVYLEVQPVMAHNRRERKFRPIVFIFFILIDSGSVIFITQLCYTIIVLHPYITISDQVALAQNLIVLILRQVPLNGIIPTIILVREALGMSYNDITPLSQTIESLHFAHNDDTLGNSNQEVEQCQ
ncbi:hypothetical protein BYT27DRAFT_7253428 [Phlegmacium glaucopus]|nr:hypothetical protein BYT27DRAFT_7253428 [Phlegmacium glaucopus]